MSKTNKRLDIKKFSRITKHGLSLLASEIQLARKIRKMTETELATRVGCSRDTIRAIEAGKPTVSVAFIFEAAAILGLDLFGGSEAINNRLHANRAQLRLLPASVRNKLPDFDDDF